MDLPTLQDGRESGDIITLHKMVNGIEKISKQDLVMMNEENGQTRGHSKKISKSWCSKDIRKYSFSLSPVDICNLINEVVVTATNIPNFKEILDKWRYGDGTL